MARSSYIYLVYHNSTGLLAAFTVKREAVHWMESSRWSMDDLTLRRTVDGGATDHAAQLVTIDPYKQTRNSV